MSHPLASNRVHLDGAEKRPSLFLVFLWKSPVYAGFTGRLVTLLLKIFIGVVQVGDVGSLGYKGPMVVERRSA